MKGLRGSPGPGRRARLAALALGAAGPALFILPAHARDETLERVDAFIQQETQRQKAPGAAVAILRKGEVLLAGGYGLANVEHGVPVTADTLFQSGSVGKQFTAVAVMLQVQDGRLGLDEPIVGHFPGAPKSWRAITVRHLLTHTSGIPDYTEREVDFRRDYSEEELARIAYGMKLEFPPGARWSYSNTGYLLLGILVHRISGRFYGDVLEERVFTPLGMKTAQVIDEAAIVPHRAAGYRLVNGELKNQEWVSPKLNTTADGALYLSLHDMIAWERGLLAGSVLKAESWARIFTPVTLRSGRSYPYGFGWSLEESGGRPRQHHGGSWQGFRSHISRYGSGDLCIVVFVNLAEADTERLVDGIAALVDPTLAPKEQEPMPREEPAIVTRLEALLERASLGRLSPGEFAYVRAGFFPHRAKQYEEMLRPLGSPMTIDLLERRELGDDRIYRFGVAYRERSFMVMLGLAPDDRISAFGIQPK